MSELAAELFLAVVFVGAALFVVYWLDDSLELEGGYF